MYVTPEINASNAFVAAWLPGSEGGGIADVLFRNANGAVAHDFRGRLSFSWPRAPDQTPLNIGDADYDPLFAYGYGLSYRRARNLGVLTEAAADAGASLNTSLYIRAGRAAPPWTLDDSSVTAQREETNLVAAWPGGASAALAVRGRAVDLSRHANGDMALNIALRIDETPAAPVRIAMRCGENCGGEIDVTPLLRAPGPVSLSIRLNCFAAAGADMTRITTPFELVTSGRLQASIESARIAAGEGAPTCPADP
jgi:beta-glucosidase